MIYIFLLFSLDAQGHLRLTDFGLAKSGITGTCSSSLPLLSFSTETLHVLLQLRYSQLSTPFNFDF